MRDVAIMEEDEEGGGGGVEGGNDTGGTLLPNLRCLRELDGTNGCCTPPPCPPPSSTTSSACSTPRTVEISAPTSTPTDIEPPVCSTSPTQPHPPTPFSTHRGDGVVVLLDNGISPPRSCDDSIHHLTSSKLVQQAHAKVSSTTNYKRVARNIEHEEDEDAVKNCSDSEIELGVINSVLCNLISPSERGGEETDENDEATDDDDNDSIISVITWESLSPRAPLAVVDEIESSTATTTSTPSSYSQQQQPPDKSMVVVGAQTRSPSPRYCESNNSSDSGSSSSAESVAKATETVGVKLTPGVANTTTTTSTTNGSISTVVTQEEKKGAVQSDDAVHAAAPKRSILSNVVQVVETTSTSSRKIQVCERDNSAKVSGLEEGGSSAEGDVSTTTASEHQDSTTYVSSSTSSFSTNPNTSINTSSSITDINLEYEQPRRPQLALVQTNIKESKMRQKGSASGSSNSISSSTSSLSTTSSISAASSTSVSGHLSMQQQPQQQQQPTPQQLQHQHPQGGDHHHQITNNNAECSLQCNGMVSECCWNGDCMEARITHLKPAIRLNPEKRQQENGKRRVTFNETLNKFFDADYVILVGEDCNGDESTRLVSMCKKSNCQPGGNFDLNFPELCPFEPPLEYIDHVTLSPPEGYKDVLGAARSALDDESESESSGEARSEDEESGQSPVCEQCSSCSACASQQLQQQQHHQQQQQQRYIVETITLTTVTERRIVREANDTDEPRLSGILKGGKLWKNCDGEALPALTDERDSSSRRSVRFCEEDIDRKPEDEDDYDKQDYEKEVYDEKIDDLKNIDHTSSISHSIISKDNDSSKIKDDSLDLLHEQQQFNAENAELTLTFRLGSSVLLSDKLPANSAVRQLFPDSEAQQRLLGVVASSGSLDGNTKDPNEGEVPSLPSPGQSGPAGGSSDDESTSRASLQIRRTIERNALRRSLLRCSEPIRRPRQNKNDDNSLVERIRQLTCDVDEDDSKNQDEDEPSSPPELPNKRQPSTYKKLTELFSRRERYHSESSQSTRPENVALAVDNSCCWLMVDPVRQPSDFVRNSASLPPHTVSPAPTYTSPGNIVSMSRLNVAGAMRKQQGVGSALGERDTPPDGSTNVGERSSMADNSYSLSDIDEALDECACPMNGQLGMNQPPDVVATAQEQRPPQSQRGEIVDELALFVQRDMGRIERIKKRYSLTDDDQDDYGFSRRPSVRGIKPRFGSTTEILQQIQLQLQPPVLACPTRAGSHLTWPYAVDPNNAATSPVSSPSDLAAQRRCQTGVPAPRGPNGLPVLPEDTYYATVPPQDYRYLDCNPKNAGGYVYATTTGTIYPRSEMVPYNPALAQQQLPNSESPPPCLVRNPGVTPVYPPQAISQYPNPQAQMFGSLARNTTGVLAPVHYANGTLPHSGYGRTGVRIPATANYAAQQQHVRSESPQRLYHRPPPTYYAPTNNAGVTVPNNRYYQPQQACNITSAKSYPQQQQQQSQQQELPSPSQRALSPVMAGSPPRIGATFERGAPEGASASPGFTQDSYNGRPTQEQNSLSVGSQVSEATAASNASTSVYYAMNV